MIELISIFVLLVSFLLLSLFPIPLNLNKNKLYLNLYYFDILSLNLIFNIILIFFISFTNINIQVYFFLIIFISILFNIHFLFKKKNYFYTIKNVHFIFFTSINLLIFIYLAKNPILAWDGLETWYFKAQNFYNGNNFFDLKNIMGHNYYPHFGTTLWGFFWKNSIPQYEYFGRMIYVYIYLLSIFSLFELTYKNQLLKIILLSLIILICFDDFLFRGYQEVLIFSFFIFISKYFYYYIKYNKNIYLILCFICLNLLPWIKNEGYLLTLVFTISLILITNKFPKKINILVFVFLTWILILIKSYIFQTFLNQNLTHGGSGLKFLFEIDVFKDYFVTILFGFIVAFFKYKIWLFIILSFFLLSNIKLSLNNERNFFKFLKINLLIYFLMLLAMYYDLSYRGDISWWVDNSLDRMLYSLSGLFMLQVIIVFNNYKNFNLK